MEKYMEIIKPIWDLFVVGSVLYAVRKFIGERLYDFVMKTDRRSIIWHHYIDKARGVGGHDGEVLECLNERCASL